MAVPLASNPPGLDQAPSVTVRRWVSIPCTTRLPFTGPLVLQRPSKAAVTSESQALAESTHCQSITLPCRLSTHRFHPLPQPTSFGDEGPLIGNPKPEPARRIWIVSVGQTLRSASDQLGSSTRPGQAVRLLKPFNGRVDRVRLGHFASLRQFGIFNGRLGEPVEQLHSPRVLRSSDLCQVCKALNFNAPRYENCSRQSSSSRKMRLSA